MEGHEKAFHGDESSSTESTTVRDWHLSYVGRLSTHVWAGDDLEPGFPALHTAVILDVVHTVLSLHTGMPAAHKLELPCIPALSSLPFEPGSRNHAGCPVH